MGSPTGNPFADPDAASDYEAWYETAGRRADRLEKALLKRLLARFREAGSLLEVGCGTGHFTRWFEAQGLAAAGLDVSTAMLSEAIRLDSALCVRGDALALPISDDAFDLVALITALEFAGDPAGALAEALRTARLGLVLGVLNRHSLLGWQMRRAGGPIWDRARFFTPAELVRLVQRATRGRRIEEIYWRTTLWPLWSGSLPLPWGGFIGMAVHLSRGGRT